MTNNIKLDEMIMFFHIKNAHHFLEIYLYAFSVTKKYSSALGSW